MTVDVEHRGQRADGSALLSPPTWAGIGGLGLAGAGLLHGSSPAQVVVLTVFGMALGLVVAIDLRERRIPNTITYPGIVIALLVAATGGWIVLLLAAAGAVAAGGAIWSLSWLARGAMGLGDVKLSAFVGGTLGLGGVPLFLIAGTGIGALCALLLLARGKSRRATFAYGPALAVGACVTVLIRGMSIS